MAQGYSQNGTLHYAHQLPDGQYQILGVLAVPDMAEVCFVRILPYGEGSLAVVYRRRFYGDEYWQIDSWINANAERIMQQLTAWRPPPEKTVVALNREH